MLDIFNSDAFGIVPMTQAIEKIEYVPGRISELGLFSSTSIAATSAVIEERGGLLFLVSPSPRGAPGQTFDKTKRKMRSIAIPHFQIDDAVMADEVQGVRAFGSETALEMVMEKVAERGRLARQAFDYTHEHARLGAIKGVVTYADNSTLDLFSTFGVSQIGEIDFDLDNANPAAGVLRKKCADVWSTIADELGGLPFSGVRAFCGRAFFDDLIAHKEVREIYLASFNRAMELQTGYVRANGGQSSKIYSSFVFGDITWEVYRGNAQGSAMVNTDKVHIFPEGVPDLFRTVYGPGDFTEAVNTLGREIYARQFDMENGKGVTLEFQTNALHYCSRPRVLLRGKRT